MLTEKVKELLNTYYGNSRDDSHKEEIADFIQNYSDELLHILKEEEDD